MRRIAGLIYIWTANDFASRRGRDPQAGNVSSDRLVTIWHVSECWTLKG